MSRGINGGISRAGQAVGRALALLALLAGPAAAEDVAGGETPAEMPTDAAATEYTPQQMDRELDRLAVVGDGIALALAACGDVPQCVDGISLHEVVRQIDRIQQRIEHFAGQAGLEAPHDARLGRYRQMRDRYARYLKQIRTVNGRVDTAALEQDWVDLLDFQIAAPVLDIGPDVPDANEQATLRRFQDANDPLPMK